MITDNNHIDLIIARYLANEASGDDQLLLEQWMDSAEENRRYVEQVQWLHDKAGMACPYVKVDVTEAWNKVRIQTVVSPPKTIRSGRFAFALSRSGWMKVAAFLVLLLGVGSFCYYFLAGQASSLVQYNLVAADVSVNKTIGKAVKVCLNRQTTIAVTENKRTNTKELALSGEAFIQVAHKDGEKLIVKADETLIRDIGTAFNVKAKPGSSTVEVFVETGEVEFFTADQSGITLYKGETGIFDKQTKRFRKLSINNPNVNAYKTRRFVFVNTPLVEVVKEINAVYPDAIVLADPSAGGNTITVTFENERIGAIASVLSETMGLQVIKSGKGYVLR